MHGNVNRMPQRRTNGFQLSVNQDVVTPLDEYVQAPDSTYTYEYLDSDIGAVVYVINMTSHKWQDGIVVNTDVTHWLGLLWNNFVRI